MEILQLFNSNGYIAVSKQIIKEIGLDEAVIFGELVSKYYYFKNKGQLKKGGWFYYTSSNLEKTTTLSNYKQTKAIDNLIDIGWIEQKNFGTPNRRHFRINVHSVLKSFKNQFSSDLKTGSQTTSKLDSNSLENYNNNRNKNRDNNYNQPVDNSENHKHKKKKDPNDIEEMEKNGWI